MRSIYLQIMGKGVLMTIVAVMAVLSIYWGALWQTGNDIKNLTGFIIDFDGGAIGQTVTQTFLGVNGKPAQLTWVTVPASNFPGGESDVIDAVVQEKCWAAVAINPNASANLAKAIANADATYNGALAVTGYAAEARNENSYPLFILPNIQTPMSTAMQTFAIQNAASLATSRNVTQLISAAPSVVLQPVGFVMNNVRPFDVPVASAVDFVGLIYLLIISVRIILMNFNAREASGMNKVLRTSSLLRLRIVVPFIAYFFLSWFYSLLSLAFQVPFNRKFGHAGFVIYWAMSYVAMCALGLAIEALVTLLTPRFIPFFLITWIIVNVSVCFYPIEILPGVFKYGYASPFYNVSRTVRTIVFETRNNLGLNFGVQFAWIGISLITVTLFQLFMRRSVIRAARSNARQQKDEKEV
ncbi:hypothetical protein SISSUDRAFT_978122 [Sistotremastrum suecicum HHB10207 ss-3]|uniref:DUF3533 domain-containing protein n=1 Tax=Sistotremastrum suecicum HHB10207 ss-3 TaxID=1314776 RepID=A0A166IDI9_9AGAM|nr:hypothetical protein SISSUDRAFT_978122 [Sistotremastrum suecicum HHB10207 ss-3]